MDTQPLSQVVLRDGWLNGQTKPVEIIPGDTLGEIADKYMPAEVRPYTYVQVNGEILNDWENKLPSPGDHILLYVVPHGGGGGGGKRVLFAIAAIAIAIAAPQAAPFLFGPGMLGTATYWVGASLVLNLLAKSLFKPPDQQKALTYDAPAQNPFLSFSGIGNRMEPWGYVPRVYGRMRVFPKLVMVPEERVEGGISYYYLAFDFGYGPLALSNLKLGETLLTNYTGVQWIYYHSFTKNSTFKWFNTTSKPLSVNQELEKDEANVVVRTTEPNTQRTVITFALPQGLYRFSAYNGGTYSATHLAVRIEARPAGNPAAPWQRIQELAFRDPPSYPTLSWGRYAQWGTWSFRLYLSTWFADGRWYGGVPAGTTALTMDIGSDVHTGAGNWEIGDEVWIGWNTSLTYTQFKAATIVGLSGPWNRYVTVSWDGAERRLQSYTNASTIPAAPSTLLYMQIKKWNRPTGMYFGVTGKTAIREQFAFDVQYTWAVPGQYEIRMSNILDTIDDLYPPVNQIYWATMTSYANFSRKVFRPAAPHTVVELRIQATSQLSGMISDFNAVAESVLPYWNGSVWVTPTYNDATGQWTPGPTRNPAWIYADILRGSANKRPIPNHLIDADRLVEWAEFCDEPAPNDPGFGSYLCDLIINSETTVKAALQTVASVGRASPARRDAKFSVIIDSGDRTPVQLITPKNTREFSANITYARAPDGLKVSYIDEDTGYDATEHIVYNDGFNESNATVFEDISLPGTTRRNQVVRHGRFYLATGILQRERVTCSMDYEQLVCQRGDIVLVAHDVLETGGFARRVMKITLDAGGHILLLDEPVAGANVIRYRASDELINITHVTPSEIRLPAGQAAPLLGDLIECGVSAEIRAPYVVEEIVPGNNLSANLSLVEFRPEVEEAITQPIPPREPRPGASGEFEIGPVRNLTAIQRNYFADGFQYSEISLTWLPPEEGIANRYNVYRLVDDTKIYVGSTTTPDYANAATVNISIEEAAQNETFYVEPVVDRIGIGPTESVTVTVVGDTVRPADMTGFGCNAQTGTLLLFWDQNYDPDIHHYEIRYSPDVAALWQDSVLLSGLIPANSRQTFVPLRPGLYLIKAVDGAGNYSENAATTVVQIDDLEYVDEFDVVVLNPFTDGTHENTEIDGFGDIILQAGQTLGYYTPDPAVHKIELLATSKMRLYAGITLVLMDRDSVLGSAWFIPLAHAAPLQPSAEVSSNIVDAQIEFRYRALVSDPFGPWTRLIVADVTAIEVEFRVQLFTKNLRYSPAVTAASIKADWLERTEIGQDIAIPAGGMLVNFVNAFAVTPVLAITFQDAAAGDYHLITTPTRSGFYITLYNASGTSIAGLIDFLARGYGKEY